MAWDGIEKRKNNGVLQNEIENIKNIIYEHNGMAIERHESILDAIKYSRQMNEKLVNKMEQIEKECAKRSVNHVLLAEHLEEAKEDKKRMKDQKIPIYIAVAGWLIAIVEMVFFKRHGQ